MSYICQNAAGEPTVRSAELVWLRTEPGSIIPAAWVRKTGSEYVALFAHSNGDDLGNAMVEAQRLSDALELSVLAFDYTGYGLSELAPRGCRDGAPIPSGLDADRNRATPSEVGCYADIDAAYNYLRAKIPATRIVLVGRSIGSGPVVNLAARMPVAGVVLVAPIASAVRVALQRVRVTLPLIDTFANIDKVARIACPVLVVHGARDELVPVRHAQLLVARVKHAVEPLFVPSAAHNNVVEDNQSLVFGRCRGFLQELPVAAERPLLAPSGRLSGALLRAALALPRRAGAACRAAARTPPRSVASSDPPPSCLRRSRRRTCARPRAGAPPSSPARRSAERGRPPTRAARALSAKERAIYAANYNTSFVTDPADDSDQDDSLIDALLRGPSVSMEFISYPVDDTDRLSLSAKEGLAAYLRRNSRRRHTALRPLARTLNAW